MKRSKQFIISNLLYYKEISQLFLISFFILSAISSFGQHNCSIIPEPGISTHTQSDGSILEYEKHHIDYLNYYRATKDGYTILQKGEDYYYALKSEDGSLYASDIKANNSAVRTETEQRFLGQLEKNIKQKPQVQFSARSSCDSKSFPATGTNKALLILVDFPDAPATFTQSNFNNYCNQSGYSSDGAIGSFKDYFNDVSDGQLDITTTVVGWYTAAEDKAYYASDPDGDGSRTYSTARELVREAVNAANDDGLDFSDFDNNNDGFVDVVMLIHEGMGAESTSGDDTLVNIWSHKGRLCNGGEDNVDHDGVTIQDYFFGPEKRTATKIAGIGTYCHEFGHSLGWPDLYPEGNGLGNFCLMASGNFLHNGRIPCEPSVWCKDDVEWISPTVKTKNIKESITNMAHAADPNAITYRINTGNADQYFLLENRVKKDWDQKIPDAGLAIYHINEANYGDVGENRGVNLEQADGDNDLENDTNRGDAGDLYSDNADFNFDTDPSSDLDNNTETDIYITDARIASDKSVSFYLGRPDLTPNNYTAPATAEAGSTVTLTAKIKNVSYGRAKASKLRYYLSTNTTWNSSDIILGLDFVTALNRNQLSIEETVDATIPASTLPGNYHILFRADDEFVVAEHNENNNVRSRSITITAPSLPAPTSVQATDGIHTDKVTISWNAVNGAMSYRLYRSETINGTYTPFSPIFSGLSYNHFTAIPGKLYYYKVKASPYSNGSNLSPFSTVNSGYRKLTKPTITATDGTYDSYVRLVSSLITGATHYKFYRATTSTGTYSEVSGWQSSRIFNDQTAIQGRTYYYKVRAAANSTGGRISASSNANAGYRKLAKPLNVSASDNLYTSYTRITWSPVPYATGYRVYRANSYTGVYNSLSVVTSNSFNDVGATPGRVYYYKVRAYKNTAATSGPSPFSIINAGSRKLGTPSITATDGTYTTYTRLTSSAVTGATHYKFFRATTSTGTYTAISGWQTGRTLNYSAGATGRTYYYKSQAAMSSSGLRPSNQSAVNSGFERLAAPSNVIATDNIYTGYIRVTWSAVPYAVRYKVYRSISANGTYSAVSGLLSGTAFNDTGATPGRLYYYKVRAYKTTAGSYASNYSAYESGRRKLSSPTLVASDGTYSSYTRLSTSGVSGGTYYRFYYATSPTGTYYAVNNWSTAKVFNWTGGVRGRTYYFKTRAATNSLGANASNYGSYNGGFKKLNSPTGVIATDDTYTNRVRVTWNAVPYAVRYRVLRATSSGGTYVNQSAILSGTVYNDYTATPGRNYYYKVIAYKTTTGGYPSFRSTYNPGRRKILAPTVSASDGTYNSYIRVVSGAVTGGVYYRFYRASPGGSYVAVTGFQTSRTFYDYSAIPGNTYYYKVRASYYSNGAYASGYSAGNTGYRPMGTPTGVAASDGTYETFTYITWNAATNAGAYRVLRRLSTSSDWYYVSGWQTNRTFYDYGGIPGQPYEYKVVAAANTSGTGSGSWSGGNFGHRDLDEPYNLAASDGTYYSYIRVSWTKPAYAIYSRVYRANCSTCSYVPVSSWTTGTVHYDYPTYGYKYYKVMVSRYSSGAYASDLSIYNRGYRRVSRSADNPEEKEPNEEEIIVVQNEKVKPDILEKVDLIKTPNVYDVDNHEVDFIAYPNPITDEVNLEFKIIESGPVHLNLFDTNGKLIKTFFNGEELALGIQKLNFNFNGLSPGTYFAILQTKNKKINRKLIYLGR